MLRIGIVIGSTRPGRLAEPVAHWVHEIAQKRGDANFELVDIADYGLPHFDEAIPPSAGQYAHQHTRTWARKVAEFDGYVLVTPEYNHAVPAALKNALDFVYAEWNDKAVGFVSYGGSSGVRAVEQLRQVAGELQLADVRTQVELSLFTDFVDYSVLAPTPRQEGTLTTLLDQVVKWSTALRTVRASR